MDPVFRNKWMWSTALELVQYHDFQLVDLQEDKRNPFGPTEVQLSGELPRLLLMRNKGRRYELIRLTAVDIAWPSMVNRDISSLADKMPSLRKYLKAGTLHIYNLYVFAYFTESWLEDVFKAHGVIEENRHVLFSESVHLPLAEQAQPADQAVGLWSLRPSVISRLEGFDPEIVDDRIGETWRTKTIPEIKERVNATGRQKEREFLHIFHYGRPIFTSLFLLINVLFFLYVERIGSTSDLRTLVEYGAKFTPLILEGEYWRFITPMFLHIGFIHMFVNSIALFFLGTVVERIYGSMRFVWMYLFAGFVGTVASFAFTPAPAAGASGAIFGCFGALLYFGWKRRDLFFRTMGMDVLIILMINLGIGFLIPVIDNNGHIGGLVGGFLAAMMIGLPKRKVWIEQIAAVTIAVAAIGAMLYVGFSHWSNVPLDIFT